MPITEPRGPIRFAEVLGAFSLASDLAVGLHPEHGARCCYIGTRIAEELGLSVDQRTDLYYAELLKDAGCTAYTSQLAAMWFSDEITAKRDLQFFREPGDPRSVVPWMMQYIAVGAAFPTRVARMLDFLRNGREFMREGFESTCHVATRIAERLGMPQPVQDALMQLFEQWDGRGLPHGTTGRDIPIISRIVLMTSFVDVFHRMAGREGAKRMSLEQRGRAFDPSVVDAFVSVSQREAFWNGLEDEGLWDVVLSLEPDHSPYRYIGADRLTDVALAFGDYADMKSPYMAGRSRRVAELAERTARRMTVSESQAANVLHAGLVHDIGIVAVPSFVLNKPPAHLTSGEWEQLRLHPYHSERILSKVPALKPVISIVAAHHERVDGNGYHRGLPGAQIPLEAQIIAVAARFDELCHDQPGHSAVDSSHAIDAMRQEIGAAHSWDVLQALIEELGGAAPPIRRRPPGPGWPAGLTDREVEVLRLVARGLNRREAANALVVSEGTVRSHLEHIYVKIGVSNRASATLFAMEHGLLS